MIYDTNGKYIQKFVFSSLELELLISNCELLIKQRKLLKNEHLLQENMAEIAILEKKAQKAEIGIQKYAKQFRELKKEIQIMEKVEKAEIHMKEAEQKLTRAESNCIHSGSRVVQNEIFINKIKPFYAGIKEVIPNFFDLHEEILTIGILVSKFVLDLNDSAMPFSLIKLNTKSTCYVRVPHKLLNLQSLFEIYRDEIDFYQKGNDFFFSDFIPSYFFTFFDFIFPPDPKISKIENILTDLWNQIRELEFQQRGVCDIFVDKSMPQHQLIKQEFRSVYYGPKKDIKIRYVRHCSYCNFIMQEWEGCSLCKRAWYCTKSCQVKHWKIHKQNCLNS